MKHTIIFSLIFALFMPSLANAQSTDWPTVDIYFPVKGEYTYINDYGFPRGSNRTHEGNDLMAPKHTPVYAANDGVVVWAPIPEPSYGWGIWIEGDDGYTYVYIHLNNDTPGTDDNNGGVEYAYADGVRQGTRVSRGQLIGWLGDSGNAEHAGSHLHFEIRVTATDEPINPYNSLVAAEKKIAEPVPTPELSINYNPEEEKTQATSINKELGLTETSLASGTCESNSLIKSPTSSSVYYCAANGKRYVFSNSGTYFSWYEDFEDVITITETELAAIPLGGNVTYRPGAKLVKIQSDPKVYAIGTGGTLRWVSTAEIAEQLYGENWNKQVDDIAETFFINYKSGEAIVVNE